MPYRPVKGNLAHRYLPDTKDSELVKDCKKQQVSTLDAAYPCKRGNLAHRYLPDAKDSELVKDCKKQQVSATDAI